MYTILVDSLVNQYQYVIYQFYIYRKFVYTILVDSLVNQTTCLYVDSLVNQTTNFGLWQVCVSLTLFDPSTGKMTKIKNINIALTPNGNLI